MGLLKRAPIVNKKYFTDAFRRDIEDHLTILRNDVTATSIPSNIGIKFKDNYLGLLTYLEVPPKYKYVVMRVNKLMNPKASGYVATVYLPSFSKIEDILSTTAIAERDLF